MSLHRVSVTVLLVLLLLLAASPAPARVIRFRIDPQASRVTVAVPEPLAAFRGEAVGHMRVREGEAAADPADLEHSVRVRVVVETASYRSGNGMRDRAVRRRALAAERYPAIVFVARRAAVVEGTSRERSPAGGGGLGPGRVATLRVNGMLTLHGTTRPLSVLVKVWLDRSGRLHAEGAFPVRLGDYGIPRLRLLGIFRGGDTASVHFTLIGIAED